MPAPPAHLTGKIVSSVLKKAYPASPPGAFGREITDLLIKLDAVSSHTSDGHAVPSSLSRFSE